MVQRMTLPETLGGRDRHGGEAVSSLAALRALRPPPWPDHARYLEAAAARFGVAFAILDDEGGTLVRVGEGPRGAVIATAGRTCVYPLNRASSMALATDKRFTRVALDAARVENLGGEHFFLSPRLRGLRGPGREVDDARAFMASRGHVGFCKPLAGSRGDFAERVADRAAFEAWLARVATAHDAILIQDIAEGDEYRVLLLDDDVGFVMQRFAPELVGDGARSLAALHAERCELLAGAGLSPPVLRDPSVTDAGRPARAHTVLARGERVRLDDRRNYSAGASTRLVPAVDAPTGVVALARRAREALGLRVAGVDVMVTEGGPRVIEVNGNPSVASLEDAGHASVILDLWGEVFARMGLRGDV